MPRAVAASVSLPLAFVRASTILETAGATAGILRYTGIEKGPRPDHEEALRHVEDSVAGLPALVAAARGADALALRAGARPSVPRGRSCSDGAIRGDRRRGLARNRVQSGH